MKNFEIAFANHNAPKGMSIRFYNYTVDGDLMVKYEDADENTAVILFKKNDLHI